MKKYIKLLFEVHLFCFLVLATNMVNAQDSSSVYYKVFNFPDKFFSSINKKSERLERHLSQSTEKYFKKLAKQELRMQRKLTKKDPAAAKEIFGETNARYGNLNNALTSNNGVMPNVYSSRLDSMKTALNFFQANKTLNQSPEMQAKLQSVFKGYGDVQGKLNQTNFIERQLKERQQYLKNRLSNYGLGKEVKKYQEKVYYYRAQMAEYKNVFENPKKLESKLLQAANAIPAFSKFFNKQSQLASLFRLPGNDDFSTRGAEGLQTREIIIQQLEQKFGPGPNLQQAVSSGIANAENELSKVKDKFNRLGNGGADMDMPDFKPNAEKSKSFLNRLELGSNLQSVKSNIFFPITTDIGVNLGYKFNPKATAGIGASYKVGLGRDIRHMALSHEGLGIRAYAETKLKGRIWITGGGELNYRSSFKNFEALKHTQGWQQSALAGISKKYAISNKVKGNIQFLYDFLWWKQGIKSEPFKIRLGYNLK